MSTIRDTIWEYFLAIVSSSHSWMVFRIDQGQSAEHRVIGRWTIITALIMVAVRNETLTE